MRKDAIFMYIHSQCIFFLLQLSGGLHQMNPNSEDRASLTWFVEKKSANFI